MTAGKKGCEPSFHNKIGEMDFLLREKPHQTVRFFVRITV